LSAATSSSRACALVAEDASEDWSDGGCDAPSASDADSLWRTSAGFSARRFLFSAAVAAVAAVAAAAPPPGTTRRPLAS